MHPSKVLYQWNKQNMMIIASDFFYYVLKDSECHDEDVKMAFPYFNLKQKTT